MDNPDPRHLANGREIPTETYGDQPYVVVTADGGWLCVLTTGAGREGEPGQHVVAMRSTDQGRTWSAPVALEPPDGPEASYAVLLATPTGRVYCFYNHNSDNLREVLADDPPFAGGVCRRVDSQGYFVCKYSDDGGRTWSPRRYPIPVREMDIDRRNPYGGAVRFFWNVGRPYVHAGAAYVPLIKVGGFGEGFFTRTEGVLLRSPNLLTETDPERFAWETLPEGDFGLRTPPGGGRIAEEQSYSVLGDGSFFAVYRTVDGHPACSYSRDGGRTWEEPRYLTYADGRPVKHPRAANFAWRCSNGKYLYWFHNHGGRDYEDRNPVWLCGGVEAEGPTGKVLRWSQPEVVLYDDDPYVRISYPDLIEDSGRYFLTETQKDIARVHELDPALLAGLWRQNDPSRRPAEGLLLELPAPGEALPAAVPAPRLPDLLARDLARADMGTRDLRSGFSLGLELRLPDLAAGRMLLDNRTPAGQGLCLHTTPRASLEIVLNDGRTESRWESDPGSLRAETAQRVTVIVDGGPKLICFVVDGVLGDGGEARQFAWGRFSPCLRGANGAEMLRLGEGVRALRLYARALRVSETVYGRE